MDKSKKSAIAIIIAIVVSVILLSKISGILLFAAATILFLFFGLALPWKAELNSIMEHFVAASYTAGMFGLTFICAQITYNITIAKEWADYPKTGHAIVVTGAIYYIIVLVIRHMQKSQCLTRNTSKGTPAPCKKDYAMGHDGTSGKNNNATVDTEEEWFRR